MLVYKNAYLPFHSVTQEAQYRMKMENSLAAISLLLITYLLLSWILKVGYSIWWKPMKLKIYFEKQGVRGPPYQLLYGNLKEIERVTQEAMSKPMDLSHKVVSRVDPFVYDTVKNYGKLSLIWYGTQPRVIIVEPELIKEVLSNKFGHFKKPKQNPNTKQLASGLVSHEGEKWAIHRRIINPAFHVEKLKRMLPSFTTSCIEMIKRWEISVVPQGSCELDMLVEFQNLTGDVISRAAFGSNYNEGMRIFELLNEHTKIFMQAIQTIYIPGSRFLPTKKNLRKKQLDTETESVLRAMINRRVKAMKNGEANNDDLLGILLESVYNDSNDSQQHKRNFNNIGMTIEDVIEECKLFYFAGMETTSHLLTWTMVTLSMHPTWQACARDEVLEVCGKVPPDFDSLSHLKIVTMILYEVLRLYSPAVKMIRQSCKWMKVGDLSLPPGVQIMLPTLLIHHDPEIWGEDVEEFKPERFSEGVSKAAKHQLAFFPFGWGPRICIGQNFAMIEAKMALAMILQHFSFELSPSYVHAPQYFIATHPQFGAQIILHKL